MLNRAKVPNFLTLLRVLAVPLVLAVILISPACTKLLFWVFLAASLTDFFDGYLARRWHATSRLGALLDPMADKLLVALLLLYFIATQSFPLVPVAVILLRELYVAGLREYLALQAIPLPVSRGGKWKTAAQMVSLLLLLFALAYGAPQAWSAGIGLLWAAAFLALLSAVDYTRHAWPHLRAA